MYILIIFPILPKIFEGSPIKPPSPTPPHHHNYFYLMIHFHKLGVSFFPNLYEVEHSILFWKRLGGWEGANKKEKKDGFYFFWKGDGGVADPHPLLCPFPPITHPWLLCSSETTFFFFFYKLNVIKFEIYYTYIHML